MDEYKFASAASAVLATSEVQLETAQESLVALKKAVAHFDQQSRLLPEQLKAEMREVLVGAAEDAAENISTHFTDANKAAKDATNAYRRAERGVYLKITLLVIGLAVVVMGAMTIWMMHMLPNEATLTAMRLEERELKANIAMLEKRAGKMDVAQCQVNAGKTRLCVRIDESAPVYKNGYRIIAGY